MHQKMLDWYLYNSVVVHPCACATQCVTTRAWNKVIFPVASVGLNRSQTS